MTQPEQPQLVFRAYTQPRRQRIQRRHVALVGGVVLVLSAFMYWAVTFQPVLTPYRLETHRGLRTVLQGMSPQDVSGILGQPIGKEHRGEHECYQYGRPSLKVASYVLHTVCYEDGKLHSIFERRYNSWVVTQDGAITPAPLEDPGELLPPATDPTPPAPSVAAPGAP